MQRQEHRRDGGEGGFRAKIRGILPVLLCITITLAARYNLRKPVPSGCIMTNMHETYIPISFTPSSNLSSSAGKGKYKLFLYHEGWRKIDFDEHVKKLSGVPLLFIPGNGGSYRQVRSIAAESNRAYQGGPRDPTFYREASLVAEEDGGNMGAHSFELPDRYSSRLDWFAVDFENEQSAMDGQLLEEQAEYVVYAIHRILDLYEESCDARAKEGDETSINLPRSVILVGHSMGGFVARAAIVHPHLRKAMVETVLTLSSPHQSPPLSLQPSLGHYYHLVNQEWRKRYKVELTHMGSNVSDHTLSHVIVVSISGGVYDYQVRSKLESLDGIVPSSHHLVIGSMSMRNVWLSMEHQSILWCNQLVVQVSHTLLSLIDSECGQPFLSTEKRLTVFTKMLHSEIPLSLEWTRQVQSSRLSTQVQFEDEKSAAGSRIHTFSPCPQSVYWSDGGLEKDLYIHGSTFTVLAMDGRRRWLDIQKLGSHGKNYFVFVTNLAPCSGIRLHLWPEGKMTSDGTSSNRVLEVTSKMVEIPTGPVPMQIESGNQTEQAPPSGIFQLGPDDMQGFRFLTVSVAPRQTVLGGPPPAACMAVGQFFNPEDGKHKFSPWSLLYSIYAQQEILLKKDHPLVLHLSFSISLGLLPVIMSIKTTGCGIKSSVLPVEEAENAEHSRICKLLCFPPVAIAWDSTSGLHVIPNLYSETIMVDSSPALRDSTSESDMTTVLLLVDPHCSFKIGASVSATAAAGRFLLLYYSEIIGYTIAVIFFALMRQSHAWELGQPLPSVLAAVDLNLRMPLSFLLLAVVPILITLFFSFLVSRPFPPLISFFVVSILCYAFANGSVIILIMISKFIICMTATVHTFIKIRWQIWEENSQATFLHRSLNFFAHIFSCKVARLFPAGTTLVVSFILVCLVHPALGLLILLLSHALQCHTASCSFLAASSHNHARKRGFLDSKRNSPRSYGDTLNHRHGLLILHLLSTLMFVPSLVAWFQRIGVGYYHVPRVLDSALCTGVILHGFLGSSPESNFPFMHIQGQQVGLSFVYLLAGFYCCITGLALAPYKAFYPMAFLGVVCAALRILARRYREKGESFHRD